MPQGANVLYAPTSSCITAHACTVTLALLAIAPVPLAATNLLALLMGGAQGCEMCTVTSNGVITLAALMYRYRNPLMAVSVSASYRCCCWTSSQPSWMAKTREACWRPSASAWAGLIRHVCQQHASHCVAIPIFACYNVPVMDPPTYIPSLTRAAAVRLKGSCVRTQGCLHERLPLLRCPCKELSWQQADNLDDNAGDSAVGDASTRRARVGR